MEVSRPSALSVEHFEAYAYKLRLDNGERFRLESFQLEIAGDIFAGFAETWLILPEGNGKTTFLAALALYHGDYVESAEVPVAASTAPQAEILYRQAAGFIRRTRGLQDRFRPLGGYRRIECKRTGGRIQVYAAEAGNGDGVIPTLALVDELHRHRNLELYETWRGKLEKRGGQLVTISTAGQPGSDFEQTRARLKRHASEVVVTGCHTRAASDSTVIHDYAVPSVEQADDFEVVAAANPRQDLTAEVLRKKRATPTMSPEHWLRFVCNIATIAGGSAISAEVWDGLAEPGVEPQAGHPVVGWLDLGWRIDTTAMGVVAWESPERRVVAGVRVVEPPVDERDVVDGLLDLQERFGPHPVVYDPNAGAQQMAQQLERGEHPSQVARGAPAVEFIEHTQDNAPMSLAASRLDEAIRNGWLVHDGNESLRRHALNAVAKTTVGEKWRYDRPSDARGEKRRNYPIDALTGLAMGHSHLVASQDVSEFVFEIYG